MSAGSCKIHLKDDAQRKAAKATYPIPEFPLRSARTGPTEYLRDLEAYQLKYADELQAQLDFTGPEFKDCVTAVNFDESGWVHVCLAGEAPGTVYSYPSVDVARVKTYRS